MVKKRARGESIVYSRALAARARAERVEEARPRADGRVAERGGAGAEARLPPTQKNTGSISAFFVLDTKYRRSRELFPQSPHDFVTHDRLCHSRSISVLKTATVTARVRVSFSRSSKVSRLLSATLLSKFNSEFLKSIPSRDAGACELRERGGGTARLHERHAPEMPRVFS